MSHGGTGAGVCQGCMAALVAPSPLRCSLGTGNPRRHGSSWRVAPIDGCAKSFSSSIYCFEL